MKHNIEKTYIMKLKVDTNDADFKYHKIEIKQEDIPHIKRICKALTKLDAIHKPKDFVANKSFGNYPTGGKYGYSMENICGSNAYTNLIEGGLKNEESFKIFDKYIGRKTFHTIHQVYLNNENLFLSNHWSNSTIRNKLKKIK